MNWPLSAFGQQLGRGSGIGDLMKDLGEAIAHGGEEIRMLGGGQPAHLPEVDAMWRERWNAIAENPGELERVLGDYEPPAGNLKFRSSIATMLNQQFGWQLDSKHVAVMAGGQTSFFFLLNSLAGTFHAAETKDEMPRLRKTVLLPLVPEYIGYANQGIDGSLFRGVRPLVDRVDKHRFKYRIDFDNLDVDKRTAAICVSRPTNPTGNVLTDDEVASLARLSRENDVPLLIDSAYGAPFPNAIFTDAKPFWDDHTILTFSLSKIGLPGTRTGIVVAHPSVIENLASMTSIVGLANTNIGQAITAPLIESGEICRIADDLVRPFYRQRSEQAMQCVTRYFDDSLPYQVHVSEGAFFLWMWFEGLPIRSDELYERLKQRGVLVVPGHHFFFGIDDPGWQHQHECIRVSFSMPASIVDDGIRVIAEEVAAAYQNG